MTHLNISNVMHIAYLLLSVSSVQPHRNSNFSSQLKTLHGPTMVLWSRGHVIFSTEESCYVLGKILENALKVSCNVIIALFVKLRPWHQITTPNEEPQQVRRSIDLAHSFG